MSLNKPFPKEDRAIRRLNQELQAKFEGLPLAQVSTITKQEKGERSQLRRNASLKK